MLTWNSHNVDATIAETLSLVRDASETLGLVKATAARAQAAAAHWSQQLLLERKEGQARPWPAAGGFGRNHNPSKGLIAS